ncbi:class I SAM-dependent methyltransferase [Salinibacterium soli]|uniref:Class I SAM-dependent methyltransferase n=1 Tax=Antiquaquibacter soli TaxID=3064523 RepID=A0ABT9BVL7_9MICO|nr:class I SAM-dependent methyltransferase [Protaetiibacter sp. WY-16]MDO7883435.1 class I SAM-dependent methyltransferase [Protaetiibacter sp. WY-16]
MESLDMSTGFGWISHEYVQSRGGAGRISALADLIDPYLCRDGIVVELGTGPGQLAARLTTATRRVVGVDISPEMIRLASPILDGNAVEADVEHLPFDAETFDGAIAVWVLNHVADPRRALSEARRVLRPGARMFYLSGIPSHPEWDVIGSLLQRLDVVRADRVERETAIVSLAESCGFRVVTAGDMVVKFSQRPDGMADRIATRSYGHLRDLDEETWATIVQPVVDELRRMDDHDRHRNRQNIHAFAVFERM